MKDSASFRFGKGKQIKRKCLTWFMALSESDKRKTFKEASFKICKFLKQGNSINLSKALTRNELGLGFKLIDHVARSSMPVLNLQHLMKQEKLLKPKT